MPKRKSEHFGDHDHDDADDGSYNDDDNYNGKGSGTTNSSSVKRKSQSIDRMKNNKNLTTNKNVSSSSSSSSIFFTPKKKSNPVEQLTLLREFVGINSGGANSSSSSSSFNNHNNNNSPSWTETDLMNCLKQCGYNVELAAEKLITGQFQKSSFTNSTNMKKKDAYFTMVTSSSSSNISNNTTISNDTRPTVESKTSVSKQKHQQSSVVTAPIQKVSSLSASTTIHASSSKRRRHTITNNVHVKEVISLDCDDDDDADVSIPVKRTNSLCSTGQNTITTNREPINNTITNQKKNINVMDGDNNENENQQSGCRNLLLCHRWISDSVCTMKNGSIGYKEIVQVEPSLSGYPQLRFRCCSAETGSSNTNNKNGTITKTTTKCEGKLPDILASILVPILRLQQNQNERRNQYIQVHVVSLMEQTNMCIGCEIPFAVSISITHPTHFFRLMERNNNSSNKEDVTSTSTTTTPKNPHYFEKNTTGSPLYYDKRNKNTIPVADAAFLLLQWAQYGTEFSYFQSPQPSSSLSVSETFNKKTTAKKVVPKEEEEDDETKILKREDSGEDDDDNDNDGIELNENDFEEASVAESTEEGKLLLDGLLVENQQDPQQQHNTGSSTIDHQQQIVTLPEVDDPIGFTPGITLRPYQKQALYFMYQREQQNNNGTNNHRKEELNEQMKLLQELTSINQQHHQQQESATSFYLQHSSNKSGPSITCDCSPVIVSEEEQKRSCTVLDCEQINPICHPLWQKRYLCDYGAMKKSYVFFVNELMGIGTIQPPEPPQQCLGGILGDAMGLGKTVMLMALILQSKQQELLGTQPTKPKLESEIMNESNETIKKYSSTTLVIAKLSLLPQWEDELRTKTNLSYKIFYGSMNNVSIRDIENVDVVVTTYGTIQGEMKRLHPVLLHFHWLRVILDEAHCIRNQRTLASKACCMLKAKYRWCVSGTIIQNSLDDVYGIMKFLKHEPWCIPSFWKAAITQPATASSSTINNNMKNNQGTSTTTTDDEHRAQCLKIALNRVSRLLSPIMLRRTKHSLNQDGQPILSLPPVETKIIKIQFNESEREFYNALLSRSLEVFDGFDKNGTLSKAYLQIFCLLQRLRQACDHIALTVKSRIGPDDWNQQQQQRIISTDVKNKDNAVCLSNHENNKIEKEVGLGNDFLKDLLSKFYSKQQTSPHRKKILSDKGNVIEKDVDTVSPAKDGSYHNYVASLLTEAVQLGGELKDECPICLDIPNIVDAVVTPCGHTFCRTCLLEVFRDAAAQKNEKKNTSSSSSTTSSIPFNNFIFPEGECPVCMKNVHPNELIIFTRDEIDSNKMTTSYLMDTNNASSRFKQRGKKELQKQQEPLTQNVKIKQEVIETKEGNPFAMARQILEDAVSGTESSKILAILKELDSVWVQDPGSKILIFSHYLGFLDLLSDQLKKQQVVSFRLDGSLNIKERMNVLEQFRLHRNDDSINNKSIGTTDSLHCTSSVNCTISASNGVGVGSVVKKGSVLLMSMSAGGEGLNITCASSCFIVEPWWNSAKEDQCMNRIHRIGQMAEIVRVRKFIVTNSVEERIVELQQRKSYVADEIYQDQQDHNSDDNDEKTGTTGGLNSKLTIDDLRLIFRK